MSDSSLVSIGFILGSLIIMGAVAPHRNITSQIVKQAEEKCANNNGFKEFNLHNSGFTCNNGAEFRVVSSNQ